MQPEQPEDDPAPPLARENRAMRFVLLRGLAVALIYGLAARITFSLASGPNGVVANNEVFEGTWGVAFSLMSVAFLCGVPFAMGYAVVYMGDIRGLWRAIWFPQIAALASLALALLFAIEGFICVVFWLPAYLALTALGGVVARAVAQRRRRRQSVTFGVVLALPYCLAVAEQHVPTQLQVRSVATRIDIQASPNAVWEEIVDVPLITEAEQGFAWSHWIGFPRPLSARTSARALGALREARFERGVVFYERVTRYEPENALEFSIKADARTIPRDALDEHVTLGGPHFDVLQGAYRIEPLANGIVRLHLSSEHRLSTHFNGYAATWSDFVMRDTQDYILRIVARRAERRHAGETEPRPTIEGSATTR